MDAPPNWGLQKVSSVILAILVVLSIAYLLLVGLFHDPLPSDLMRFAVNNTWSVDSVRITRNLSIDVRDWNRSHKSGFCSYSIIVYGRNETMRPLTIYSVHPVDPAKLLPIDQIHQDPFVVKLASSERAPFYASDANVDLRKNIIPGERSFVLWLSVSDSSQSLLAHGSPAPIDRVFESEQLTLSMHSSREKKKVTVTRYSTQEVFANRDQIQGWILPRSSDFEKRAWQILKSNPDSALTLLSEAIRLDSTDSEAYQLIARIYCRRGDDRRAAMTLSQFVALNRIFSHDEVFLLACLKDRIGDEKEARKLYMRVVALCDSAIMEADSSSWRWVLELRKAQALAFAGRDKEAQAAYQMIRRRINPDYYSLLRKFQEINKKSFLKEVMRQPLY